VRVADEEMLRALRVATVERGIDPRRYALLAFGGAGPMHAARLAHELGVARIVCPPTAGVLSALGLATAGRRRDAARTVFLSERDVAAGLGAAAVRELAEAASRGLAGARVDVTWDMRYAGQAFELPVQAPADAGVAALRRLFERAHEERYGYADPDGALEIVNLRVSATVPRGHAAGELPPLAAPRRGTRDADFDGLRVQTAVLGGPPPAGERIAGPAILELEEATVVVPPGWSATSDAAGAVLLDRANESA